MYKSFFWKMVGAALAVLALTLGSTLHAQAVSSGLTGVVKDSSGKPIAGAAVTATHVPTGTVYRAVTHEDGRFEFRGLNVGGPYTVNVTASGYRTTERNDITTSLGDVIPVNFTVETSDVVNMEKFVVGASAVDLDSTMTGTGTVLNSQRIAAKPTTSRSLNDIISATPTVTLRSTSGDREDSMITALGTNNRYNSIMIDGARINDQFGLYASGTLSFFNPISLDTLEQLSVQVSPYDVRYSGFTGAAINAVTKSGTNEFHGSAYYLFSGDSLAGVHLQGPDVAPGPTQDKIPKLSRETYGFTFGGPIWKNKIFFFANYEKFTRITPPTNTGLTPNSADVAAIDARFQAINAAAGTKYDWGTWSNSLTNKAEDKKKLAKIDWNIVEGQRLSVRYSETSGAVPQFGNFSNTSYTGVSSSNTAGGTTGYTSNFYSQSRVEKAWATQLFSQWTPDFKTEAKYSTTKQDQLTPTVATLPEIHIFGVGGIDSGGFSITNGAIIAGTEQFRQGNIIHLKTDSYALSGDYFWNKFTFTGGFDREKSSFYNLFRAGSYGRFDYASISAFQSDTISAFSRAYYVQGTPQADLSDFAVTGLFGQAKWDVTPRLNILAGARYDFVQSGTKPPYNALFQSTFGNRNDGTVDGTNSFSPRIAVNYAIDDDRKTQLRGGFGHVLGRAPWVFFSNSYSAPGVGRFTSLTAPTSLVSYLQNGFDPANPIGSATSIPATGRYEVDYADQKIKLPSVWRGNIAIDRKIPQIDSILTLEYIQTRNDQDLWISNDNIKPTTLGADGRQRYAGSVNTQANALHPEFLNVYHTRNVSIGRSRYWSLSLDRPMKDGWGFDVSYTDGHALDAQPNGGTTASGIWGPNPVFNQNTIEPARSEFEIRNRIQVQISKKIELVKKWPTVVSLYYEGRSGNPFSFTYSNDLNGDGQSGNDLVAVPKDNTDARFDFSKMSQADQDAYFAYLKNTGLMKYAGTVAPRNAFLQPWISRLDLHFSQTIPIYHPAQVELFLDFVNFGTWISSSLFNYYEKAPQSSNDTDWRQYAGSASYAADGRIVPVFSSTTPPSSTSQIIDNIQSRWRIQVGARLKF